MDEHVDQLAFHASLPAKRMAAGALLFDINGGLLIVKPTYKDGWEIPGGAVERDESPLDACRREINEELGLNVEPSGLLCVDYNASTDTYQESLMFLFSAPVLTDEQLDSIVLAGDEIAEYKLCQPTDAIDMLGQRLGPRVQAVLTIGSSEPLYLENQQQIWPR